MNYLMPLQLAITEDIGPGSHHQNVSIDHAPRDMVVSKGHLSHWQCVSSNSHERQFACVPIVILVCCYYIFIRGSTATAWISMELECPSWLEILQSWADICCTSLEKAWRKCMNVRHGHWKRGIRFDCRQRKMKWNKYFELKCGRQRDFVMSLDMLVAPNCNQHAPDTQLLDMQCLHNVSAGGCPSIPLCPVDYTCGREGLSLRVDIIAAWAHVSTPTPLGRWTVTLLHIPPPLGHTSGCNPHTCRWGTPP